MKPENVKESTMSKSTAMQQAFEKAQDNHTGNAIAAAIRRASKTPNTETVKIITATEYFNQTVGAVEDILNKIGADALRKLKEESLARANEHAKYGEEARIAATLYRDMAQKLHAVLLENAPLIKELAEARAAEAEAAKDEAEAEVEVIEAYKEMHGAAVKVRANFTGVSLPAVMELPANDYAGLDMTELNRRAGKGDHQAREEIERRKSERANSTIRRVK